MKDQNVTWEEIEWMLEEKRLELVEDEKYLAFIIDELRKLREKYNNVEVTKSANND